MSMNAVVPAGKQMPLWAAMGKELTDELSDFASTSILDGISAYQHEFGRARLIERLSEILFIKEAQPGIAHKEFCTIPFDIVCTTNFDFLLERQYDLTPRSVDTRIVLLSCPPARTQVGVIARCPCRDDCGSRGGAGGGD
jgi:hypothetical protein